jgi:Uma2 family endonuclease
MPGVHYALAGREPRRLVIDKDRVGVKNITEPLTLAVEILSPSTRRKDMVLKRSKYEDAGVASYWIVDPAVPSFVAYDLVAGTYVEAARASGSDTADVTLPFAVSVVPSTLV